MCGGGEGMFFILLMFSFSSKSKDWNPSRDFVRDHLKLYSRGSKHCICYVQQYHAWRLLEPRKLQLSADQLVHSLVISIHIKAVRVNEGEWTLFKVIVNEHGILLAHLLIIIRISLDAPWHLWRSSKRAWQAIRLSCETAPPWNNKFDRILPSERTIYKWETWRQVPPHMVCRPVTLRPRGKQQTLLFVLFQS